MLGAVLLVLVQRGQPVLVLEMDRDLPEFTSGFHPVERSGEVTFAWTFNRAVVRLTGADRRADWTCTARVRGARDAGVPQPDVTLSVDGATMTTAAATNDYQDVSLRVPARPDRPGLTLTLTASSTFVPGPADSRQLGLQVDRIACGPEGGWSWPPARAWRAAALGTAGVAAAAGVLGLGAALSLAVITVMAMGLALLLATGGGAFGRFPDVVTAVSLAGSALIVVVVLAGRIWPRVRVSTMAALALIVSVVLCALELLALLHPAKQMVDALFQAHRLDWVLAGRYFFTQPLPDGVQFPYAIGLYVTAAPFAALVTDHVLLLRTVVIAANAIAGLALYWTVARWWEDGLAGLIAVALFHLVPLPFVVLGNANLPNAFAQAVAVVTLVAATGLGGGRRVWMIPVALLAALAFLSHVSTLALLAGLLATACVIYFVFGGRAGRVGAVALAAAVIVALVAAGGLYYRHFPEVYARAIDRVWAAPAPVAVEVPEVQAPDRPAVLVRPLAWHERAADTAWQTVANVGWPILILAAAGLSISVRERDPLSLLLLAWVLAWGLFLVVGTFTRVDTQYQRYAAEFIGRVNLAGYPAAVLLAGRAAARAWRPDARRPIGLAALLLVAVAVAFGINSWRGWLA